MPPSLPIHAQPAASNASDRVSGVRDVPFVVSALVNRDDCEPLAQAGS